MLKLLYIVLAPGTSGCGATSVLRFARLCCRQAVKAVPKILRDVYELTGTVLNVIESGWPSLGNCYVK
jgi:hypothetical protein